MSLYGKYQIVETGIIIIIDEDDGHITSKDIVYKYLCASFENLLINEHSSEIFRHWGTSQKWIKDMEAYETKYPWSGLISIYDLKLQTILENMT